jgi:periplasmic divalent cation tolerance protein
VQAFVVITTVGTEEQANMLAGELVSRRHAACVNIIPGLRSVYRWQGKVCRDGEFMLVIKTLESEYPAVRSAIQELHPYELPEIIGYPAGQSDVRFVEWISSCLDKDADFVDEDDEGGEDFDGDDTDAGVRALVDDD